MDIKRVFCRHRKPVALASLLFAALTLTTATACAQGSGKGTRAAEEPGFLAVVGRWFDRQAQNLNSSFQHAGKGMEEFGHAAGIAARTTVNNAKHAADAVARLPKARVVNGHTKCHVAPNGAPDCVAAASHICKDAGFRSGKSVDMTTAEVCPPKVYLAGRNSGPGCHSETFVSSALCQ